MLFSGKVVNLLEQLNSEALPWVIVLRSIFLQLNVNFEEAIAHVVEQFLRNATQSTIVGTSD